MPGNFADKSVVLGTSGNDDLRANYQDTDGSYLYARDGNDILRGGSYNDILDGGKGNDQYWGGLGADEFRFFATDITAGAKDAIYDLKFVEGDLLVFGGFDAGEFVKTTGVNAFSSGTAAQVSSYEGLAHLVADSGAIWATQKPTTDILVLHMTYGGVSQTIEISNAYSAYVAAGGIIG
jgi:Ca2+-binding RTX toxin-like protein